jgi:TonB-dependent SusC/RagA subfamily outer membrane receptor
MKNLIHTLALMLFISTISLAQDTLQVKPSKSVQLLPNQPKTLFVLDDVEIPNSDLRVVKPEDIEKIEVLKDSKAVEKYGEKGKDGVVIITTTKKYKAKKSKPGQ